MLAAPVASQQDLIVGINDFGAAVIERAREILFNLEKQELDETGLPRMAHRSSPRRDRSQLFLFQADREEAILKEIKDRIEDCDLSALTPLEAMNFVNELKEKLKTV